MVQLDESVVSESGSLLHGRGRKDPANLWGGDRIRILGGLNEVEFD